MVGLGLFGLGAAVGYTALIQPVYMAKTTLVIPNSEARTPGAMPITPNPLGVIRGVVQSIEMQRRVSNETGIRRLLIAEKLGAKADLPRNQIEIFMADTSKEQALAVVTSASKHLKALANETGLGTADRQAVVLKQAITDRQAELDTAVAKLTEFQEGAATAVNPGDPSLVSSYKAQLLSVETSMGALSREIDLRRRQAREAGRNPNLPSGLSGTLTQRQALLEAEFNYETNKKRLGEDNPQLVRQKEQLDSARRAFQAEVANRLRATQEGLDGDIATLEAERQVLAVQRDFWKALADRAPEEAVQFLRLQFEVDALAAVVQNLQARYEESLIKAEVDAVRWSELSPPRVQPEPVNKNFGLNAFLGLMVGAMVGGAFAILKDGRERHAQ